MLKCVEKMSVALKYFAHDKNMGAQVCLGHCCLHYCFTLSQLSNVL